MNKILIDEPGINLIKKWTPILEMLLNPYNIKDFDEDVLLLIVKYFEKSFSIDGAEQIRNVMSEFKNKLLTDVDIRINVKSVYYNCSIKRIVYELENGDSVYLPTQPLLIRNQENVDKIKNIFKSIINDI